VTDQETVLPVLRRVVVAEDESLIRLDIVEILRDNGFEVVGEAGDGETAVALAMELRPDGVIMDVKMPQLDGISAAERLTKAHIAPVVLLTAFSQKELVERATEAGALAYVVKPFTPSDLLPAIEIALSRYAQIVTLEDEVADMVERFETRKLVERAKGLLNEKMGLSEPEAFRWIQKASMNNFCQKKIKNFGRIARLLDQVCGFLIRFVMRMVEQRRPSWSVMAISCVVSVRPR
jgi:AmiR/NasT family two-component response regulator